MREEADTCNRKWTTVVTESKDTIATALSAMTALLENKPALVHNSEPEKSDKDNVKDVKKEAGNK